MELFEHIRRDHDREGLSIRALAGRHGVHRRTVRQALASALPPEPRRPEGRPAPALGPHRALIDEWLIADLKAPPKQRHTARRIWRRLVTEHGARVAEPTVREWVRKRRRELGLTGASFVPQVHLPAEEAEVDWFEAEATIGSERRRIYCFLIRLCHSGASFCLAFERQTQQAFLEAHVEAFGFFGGVPALIRYDNLRAAVKQVVRGRRRIEADRFVALRSHYLFDSQFTRPGREGAHEKGGVEGEVGRVRRTHLVPVPRVESLGELNARLRATLTSDRERTIRGRGESIEAAFTRERALLRPLPGEPFDATECTRPRVDQKALVCVRQNRYSVPTRLVGLRVLCRVSAREVRLFHDGAEVARHERLPGRLGVAAHLDHYLELLLERPGALRGSLPLHQERKRGSWPTTFDSLWRALEARHGASEAARQMVEVLLLCREVGPARVELAARGALAAGAHDGRAVAVLARRGERAVAEPLCDLPEALARTARPEPDLASYDALLGGAR